MAAEDHAPVVEFVIGDEGTVGGEARVVPIIDVVAAHLVAPLIGALAVAALRQLGVGSTCGLAFAHQDHMQRKDAAKSFKGPSRIAADGQGQLVFRQVLLGGQMQIGIDHVWLSPFRPFVTAEEFYARRVRRTESEAQRRAAALFAVFHLDAAPAIATAN